MAVSTEVCARDEMAAQKKTDSATTIFTLRLNPRDVRKSHREIRHVSVVSPQADFGCLFFIPARQRFCRYSHLHRNGRFDRWVRVVADKLEVFKLEIVNVFYGRIQSHSWKGPTIA
jgi:hypothetical protein